MVITCQPIRTRHISHNKKAGIWRCRLAHRATYIDKIIVTLWTKKVKKNGAFGSPCALDKDIKVRIQRHGKSEKDTSAAWGCHRCGGVPRRSIWIPGTDEEEKGEADERASAADQQEE